MSKDDICYSGCYSGEKKDFLLCDVWNGGCSVSLCFWRAKKSRAPSWPVTTCNIRNISFLFESLKIWGLLSQHIKAYSDFYNLIIKVDLGQFTKSIILVISVGEKSHLRFLELPSLEMKSNCFSFYRFQFIFWLGLQRVVLYSF